MNTLNTEIEFSKEGIKVRYLSFTGRLNRQPYLLRNISIILANLVISFFFLICLSILGIGLFLNLDPISIFTAIFSTALGITMFIIFITLSLILTISQISLSIRRLHDLNYSGWWLLAIYVISMIPIIQFLGLIAMILLFCIKGTTGTNKYGEDPLKAEHENHINEIEQ